MKPRTKAALPKGKFDGLIQSRIDRLEDAQGVVHTGAADDGRGRSQVTCGPPPVTELDGLVSPVSLRNRLGCGSTPSGRTERTEKPVAEPPAVPARKALAARFAALRRQCGGRCFPPVPGARAKPAAPGGCRGCLASVRLPATPADCKANREKARRPPIPHRKTPRATVAHLALAPIHPRNADIPAQRPNQSTRQYDAVPLLSPSVEGASGAPWCRAFWPALSFCGNLPWACARCYRNRAAGLVHRFLELAHRFSVGVQVRVCSSATTEPLPASAVSTTSLPVKSSETMPRR